MIDQSLDLDADGSAFGDWVIKFHTMWLVVDGPNLSEDSRGKGRLASADRDWADGTALKVPAAVSGRRGSINKRAKAVKASHHRHLPLESVPLEPRCFVCWCFVRYQSQPRQRAREN